MMYIFFKYVRVTCDNKSIRERKAKGAFKMGRKFKAASPPGVSHRCPTVQVDKKEKARDLVALSNVRTGSRRYETKTRRVVSFVVRRHF